MSDHAVIWRLDAMMNRLDEIEGRLARIERSLARINRREEIMSVELDNLKTKIAAMTSVVGGVKTLVEGLAKQIRDNQNSPAELNAMADELDADAKAIGKVITDNTIAQPPAGP